jgi:O-antigen ligase
MRLILRCTLVTVLLVFLPWLYDSFEGPKGAVLRIAGMGLLVTALARSRDPQRARWWAGDVAVAAWLASELLTTVTARSPSLALFGEWQQQEGLLTSLGLAGIWLGARQSLRDARSWERTLDAWLAGTAVACAFAFLQALGVDPIGWVGTATLGGTLRPLGTLGHANLLGLVAAAAAAAAVARAVVAPTGGRWYAAAALWFTGAAILTLSRGAWLGLGAGVLVAGVLAVRAGGAPGNARRLGIGMAGAVAALVAAITAAGGWPKLAGRLAEFASPSTGSARSRLEIWRIAVAEWRDRPWLGQGPDNFYLAFHQFQTPAYWRTEWGGFALHAHSIYLHALATRGVLGFLAAAAVAVVALVGLVRGWRAGGTRRAQVPALAGGLVALAVAGAFGAAGNAGGVIAALLLAGAGWLGERGSEQPAPAAAGRRARRAGGGAGSRRRPTAAIAAGVLAAGLMAALSVRSLSVSHVLWMTRDSLDQLPGPVSPEIVTVYDAVAARLRGAVRDAPWDDTGARLLAEALAVSSNGVPGRERQLDEAAAAAREAIRRQPLRPDAWRRLGDALAARAAGGAGVLEADCDSAFARAAALAPCDAYQLVQWSRARLALGRIQEAREPVERAIALYPDHGNPQAILAEVELALGDSSAARRRLDRALALTWYDDGGARAAAEQLRAELGGR